MFKPAGILNNDDYLYLPAADQFGEGWWGDRWQDVKDVAKKVQKSDTVRSFEKGALQAGSTALRGVVETGLDGIADSALTFAGAPELAPLANKLIDKGAKSLQQRGVNYLDQQIDASGNGRVRYLAPSGGGMRLAGSGTQLGSGMRLAGSGMRLAGSGMRLAGSGQRVRPLYEGGGCACH